MPSSYYSSNGYLVGHYSTIMDYKKDSYGNMDIIPRKFNQDEVQEFKQFIKGNFRAKLKLIYYTSHENYQEYVYGGYGDGDITWDRFEFGYIPMHGGTKSYYFIIIEKFYSTEHSEIDFVVYEFNQGFENDYDKFSLRPNSYNCLELTKAE